MESSGDTKCLKIIMSSPHWQNKTTVLDKHLGSLLMNLFWYLQFCFSHNQNLNNVFNSCYNALVLNLDTILKIPSISCKPKQPLVQHLTSHIHSPSIYLLFGFFFFHSLSPTFKALHNKPSFWPVHKNLTKSFLRMSEVYLSDIWIYTSAQALHTGNSKCFAFDYRPEIGDFLLKRGKSQWYSIKKAFPIFHDQILSTWLLGAACPTRILAQSWHTWESVRISIISHH